MPRDDIQRLLDELMQRNDIDRLLELNALELRYGPKARALAEQAKAPSSFQAAINTALADINPEWRQQKPTMAYLTALASVPGRAIMGTTPGKAVERASQRTTEAMMRDPGYGERVGRVTTGMPWLDTASDVGGSIAGHAGFLAAIAQGLSAAGLAAAPHIPPAAALSPALGSAAKGAATALTKHALQTLSAPEEAKPTPKELARDIAFHATAGPAGMAIGQALPATMNPWTAAAVKGAGSGLASGVATMPFAEEDENHLKNIGMQMATMALFNIASLAVNPTQRKAAEIARDRAIRQLAGEREAVESAYQKFGIDAPKRGITGDARGQVEREIRDVYRHMARRAHPDVGGTAEGFQELTAARDSALQYLEKAAMPKTVREQAAEWVNNTFKNLFAQTPPVPETSTALVPAGGYAAPSVAAEPVIADTIPATPIAPADATEAFAPGEATTPAEPEQAPVKVPQAIGKPSKVFTSDNQEIDTVFAVVGIDDLLTSHDLQLRENPDYPQELQPRDRERAAYELQVRNIASKLQPPRLGESAEASAGAPVVGPDMVVESGNGRIIALNRLALSNHPNWEKYQGWLMENAEQFGVNPSVIGDTQNPVLVRIRQTDVDRVGFTGVANVSDVAAMSATEQAVTDTKKMTPGLMAELAPGEDSNMLAASNRDFIKSFFAQVIPSGERGRYIMANGSIGQEGIRRIQNAVFAYAYGDNVGPLEQLAEDPDSNVRNITGSMLNVAGKIAATKQWAVGKYAELGIAGDMSIAAAKLGQLRFEGTTVQEFLIQAPMFGEELTPEQKNILAVFDQHKHSRKKLTEIFSTYADAVLSLEHPDQEQMFAVTIPTKNELLQAAINLVESDDYGLQTALWGSEPVEGQSAGESLAEALAEQAEIGSAPAEIAGTEEPTATGEAGEGLIPEQETTEDKVYHRFSNKESPLSDYGHAMFSDDMQAVEGYGKNHFTYDGRSGVHIDEIYDDIAAAWERDKELEFFGEYGGANDIEWAKTVSGEEIADGFIPRDIVDSGENWDTDLTQWIWERVLEPRGIAAVRWDGGAIVFDPDLIQKAGDEQPTSAVSAHEPEELRIAPSEDVALGTAEKPFAENKPTSTLQSQKKASLDAKIREREVKVAFDGIRQFRNSIVVSNFFTEGDSGQALSPARQALGEAFSELDASNPTVEQLEAARQGLISYMETDTELTDERRELLTEMLLPRFETAINHLEQAETDTARVGAPVDQPVEPTLETRTSRLAEAEKELGAHVDETLDKYGPGKVGIVPESMRTVERGSVKSAEYGIPEEVAERLHAAREPQKPSFLDKTKKLAQEFANQATRKYPFLPSGAKYAEAKFTLTQLEKQSDISSDRAKRMVQGYAVDLSPDDADLLWHKIIMDDQAEDLKRGKPLSFGWDKAGEDEFRASKKRVDAAVEANPAVKKAVAYRREGFIALRDELVEALQDIDVDVSDILTRENYYRHNVLEYMHLKRLASGKGGIKAPTPKRRSYMQERTQNMLDYSTNWVEVDAVAMSAMLYDIGRAKAIKRLRDEYDIIDEIQSEAEKTGSRWQELIPEGYIAYYVKEGDPLFVSTIAIPAQIAQSLLEDQAVAFKVAKETVRFSPYPEMVIPKELAATLDRWGRRREENVIERIARRITNKWKAWQLISPRRVAMYNIRNVSGDTEAAFIGSPSTFEKASQAAKELAAVLYLDKAMTPEMREWFERGGMQSNLTTQEAGDVNQLRMFIHLERAKGSIKELPLKAFQKAWEHARLATDYREAILRYAAYLDYKEQIHANGGRPNNFGASIPEEVMALSDWNDRAFKLSNDLLGAYDDVSAIGQYLREHIAPFWSWHEVNTKRYIQFMKNAAREPDAATAVGKKLGAATPGAAYRVGKFWLKAMALWAALSTFNHLLFGEEEEELPEYAKGTPHIVLGRDSEGKIRYLSQLGSTQDFLEWFGVDELPKDVMDFLNGRRTLQEIVTDMVKKPINKAVSAIGPLQKVPAELLAMKETFPDVFKPRPIREKWIYIARNLGLEDEYRALTKYPSRGYRKSLSKIFIYKVDPDENAYWEIIDSKEAFKKKIGKETVYGASTQAKSLALYHFKVAVRFGDEESAQHWLMQYALHGGTKQGLDASLRFLDPLSGLSKQDQQAFLQSLSPNDMERLRKAQKYWKKLMETTSNVPVQGLPSGSRGTSRTRITVPKVSTPKAPKIKIYK